MENRRSFIKKAALMTAGSAIFANCIAPQEQRKEIGLQLYTLRNQLVDNFEKTLERVAEIGYTHIESAGHGGGAYYKLAPKEFGELLKKLNLNPISGHYSSGIPNPSDVGTLSNGWDRALDEMNEIGQKYAVLGYLREEERTSLEDYKRLVDLLNFASEKANKAGIQLCYHNHDFEFKEMEGELPMYYILDNTDKNLLKMELDLYWITKAGYDIKEFFTRYSGRVALWHAKDMDSNGDFTEVGNGSVDFDLAFKNKELAGLDYFFVEQDQSNDPLKSIKKSFDFVKANLV